MVINSIICLNGYCYKGENLAISPNIRLFTNLFYTDTNTGYRLNSNQFDMNMGSVNSLIHLKGSGSGYMQLDAFLKR